LEKAEIDGVAGSGRDHFVEAVVEFHKELRLVRHVSHFVDQAKQLGSEIRVSRGRCATGAFHFNQHTHRD
jgi:hypothetical protein